MAAIHEEVALALWQAETAVAFTGAGSSTASGLPDFRSTRGLWRQFPEALASRETLEHALEERYEEMRAFYLWRLETLQKVDPNPVHRILAQWEQRGLLAGIITQNVDGLHQRAGSQKVFPLHGDLHTIRCQRCGRFFRPEAMAQGSCPVCGGRLRPHVVLFGEALPRDVWDGALDLTRQADLMLAVGSSLQVYPAASLPRLAAQKGKLIIINQEPTPLDDLAFRILHQDAGEALAAIDRELSLRIPPSN
ncbi:MAG: NAD-dependent deacylase [Bacillota bacterium]|nr:NAD-dependent deacylase [Bacillota bacterium]